MKDLKINAQITIFDPRVIGGKALRKRQGYLEFNAATKLFQAVSHKLKNPIVVELRPEHLCGALYRHCPRGSNYIIPFRKESERRHRKELCLKQIAREDQMELHKLILELVGVEKHIDRYRPARDLTSKVRVPLSAISLAFDPAQASSSRTTQNYNTSSKENRRRYTTKGNTNPISHVYPDADISSKVAITPRSIQNASPAINPTDQDLATKVQVFPSSSATPPTTSSAPTQTFAPSKVRVSPSITPPSTPTQNRVPPSNSPISSRPAKFIKRGLRISNTNTVEASPVSDQIAKVTIRKRPHPDSPSEDKENVVTPKRNSSPSPGSFDDAPREFPRPDSEPELPEKFYSTNFWTETRADLTLRSGKNNEWIKGQDEKLTVDGLLCLRDGEWLNADMIDAYLDHICRQRPDVRFIPTYAILSFERKKRIPSEWYWRLADARTILSPAHLNNNHWAMAVVDRGQRRLTLMDSMNHEYTDSAKRQFMDTTMNILRDVAQQQGVPDLGERDAWDVAETMEVPQQNNGIDCGIFALIYAKYAAEGRPLDFQQRHIPYFRRRICHDIIASIESSTADDADPQIID